jgi:hypothetical protein
MGCSTLQRCSTDFSGRSGGGDRACSSLPCRCAWVSPRSQRPLNCWEPTSGRTWGCTTPSTCWASRSEASSPAPGFSSRGTLTAQPWPGRIFKGLADLKWGSRLLETLNGNLDTLQRVECHSFYSAIDLAVLPGWRAVLPIGARTQLPVATHPQLLRDQAAIRPLAEALIRL